MAGLSWCPGLKKYYEAKRLPHYAKLLEEAERELPEGLLKMLETSRNLLRHHIAISSPSPKNIK
ncbi:MAG: hypothetical protein AABX10_00015 [Nanoarchaeota archaeon]